MLPERDTSTPGLTALPKGEVRGSFGADPPTRDVLSGVLVPSFLRIRLSSALDFGVFLREEQGAYLILMA